MNNKGQMLMGALVALVLISMASVALCQLMTSAVRQNAAIQRTSNWNSLQGNIKVALANQTSCNATVTQAQTASTSQSISILLASSSPLLVNGDNLGYQLTNASISLTYIGAPTANIPANPVPTPTPIVTTVQEPCGNTITTVTAAPIVNTTTYTQQAAITVSALYVPLGKAYKQVYYVNLLIGTNGNIAGCILN